MQAVYAEPKEEEEQRRQGNEKKDEENVVAHRRRLIQQPWPVHPLLRAVVPTAGPQLMQRFVDDDDLLSVLRPFLTLRSIIALPAVNKAWLAKRLELMRDTSPWNLQMLRNSKFNSTDRGLLEAMATRPHPRRYHPPPPLWSDQRIRVKDGAAQAKLALHPTHMDRVVLQVNIGYKWRVSPRTNVYHRIDITAYIGPQCERLKLTPFHTAHVWQLGKTLRTGIWINRRLEPLHCHDALKWNFTRYISSCSLSGPWLRTSVGSKPPDVCVDVELGAVGMLIPGATPQFESSRGSRPRRLYLFVRIRKKKANIPVIEPLLLPEDMTDFLLDMCRGVRRCTVPA